MIDVAHDPAIDLLTAEQLVSASTRIGRVFLESAPGSGKTTVATQRFGAQRFSVSTTQIGEPDHRAVLAVSFTRSATRELRGRVQQNWGDSALRWPHRVTTLDTVVYELLEHLLAVGLIQWPGGHSKLEVHDSWRALIPHAWTRAVTKLVLADRTVRTQTAYDSRARSRREPAPFRNAIGDGVCTHEDVRLVLEMALALPDVEAALQEHLRASLRAFIVDEVFDANVLDLRLIELAMAAGISVTLIGDPWQALYGFRGARPDLIPNLLSTNSVQTLKLTKSFRWRTEEQACLADNLRNGRGVELPQIAGNSLTPHCVDAVLASVWNDLWSAGSAVLPLAWGSSKGNAVESATTLLLNEIISKSLGSKATYLTDALSTLRVSEPDAPQIIEVDLQEVLALVAQAEHKSQWNAAYDALVDVVSKVSPLSFPKAHANYTKRLKALQTRLRLTDQLIPGMTVHQAKGREWGTVACRLSESEADHLAAGLDQTSEKHRQLYVACTRARDKTLRV